MERRKLYVWAGLFLFHAWIVFFSGMLPAFAPAENSRAAFYNDPDKTLNTCILQWNLKSLKQEWGLSIRDAPIFFPCRFAKFFSEHLFAHMVYAIPVSIFRASPQITYNLTYQLNRLTIGIAASLLCIEIGAAFLSSLLAGGFLITAWKFGQIQNTGLCWTLLTILFFIREVKNPSWKNAFLISLFGTLTMLSSGYLAFYTPVTLLLFLMVRILYTKSWPDARWIRQIAVSAALIAIAIVPAMLGYREAQRTYGLVRQDYHVAELVLPFLHQPQTVQGKEEFVLTNIATAEVFFCLFTLILILFRRIRFSGWEWSFLMLAVLSFWMAFFDSSPYALIARLPGFNGLRAAYRWYYFWIAAITVLVSMLFTAFQILLPRLGKFFLIVAMLFLITDAAIPQREISNPSQRLPESHVYSFLSTLPSAPVCILPIEARGRFLYRIATADRMLYQLPYSYRTLSGYSGYVPPITRLIENKLMNQGLSRKNLSKLARTGVRYVVIDNLLGDPTELFHQLRASSNCKILYDRDGEMIAELPATQREEDMEKLIDLWRTNKKRAVLE